MKNPGFKAIVADYMRARIWQDLSGMWGCVVFFRLPGFIVAWLAIRLGISATFLTFLGFVTTVLIALASCFLPLPAALISIALLAACFQILDCADGTVARATATSSLGGRFLDVASDVLWRTTCLAAIGHVADRISPGAVPTWLAVGMLAGFFATYARFLRCYVDTLPDSDAPAGDEPAFRPTIGRLAFAFLSGLDEIFALIALAAWALDGLEVLMVCAAIYHGADILVAAQSGYARLSKRDRQEAGSGKTSVT